MKSAIARIAKYRANMANFGDRTMWTGDNLGIFRGLNSALELEIWPETPILPKPLFSWRRLPM